MVLMSSSTRISEPARWKMNSPASQKYLDRIEAYSFNTMGVPVSDSTTKALYAAFCKRLRDEMGVKFQLVLHNYAEDTLC